MINMRLSNQEMFQDNGLLAEKVVRLESDNRTLHEQAARGVELERALAETTSTLARERSEREHD